MSEITWGDFEKIEMRVGTIIDSEPFPKSRNPSYKLKIDFGDTIGTKWSSAQITTIYSMEELIGKQIIAVVNFPKKQIADFMSECLILGAVNDKEVTLLHPERMVQNGLRIL
jgi:tRNA-binding protein